MRRTLIGLMSASLLFSVGCSQQPGSSPSPAASKAPSGSPSAAASAMPSATASATASASATPSASASATPDATGTPGASADQGKKLQDESGVQFKVPAGFSQEVKPDGELQLESKDEFIAINTSDTVDSGFEGTITNLKKIGGESFETKGEPKVEEQDGVKAKIAIGTLEIKGEKMTWMCMVATTGKKPLRIVAMGKELEKSENMNKFMESVKKQ